MKFTQKKTEILQVSVPYGLKREFMERCRLENRVASDVVRDFLESFLARPAAILKSETAVMIRRRFIYPTLAAAGLVGVVVATLPTMSQAQALQKDFATADLDRDRTLSAEEWECRQRQGAAHHPRRAEGRCRRRRRPPHHRRGTECSLGRVAVWRASGRRQ